MQHLAERAFTERVHDLIPIRQVVVVDNEVVATLIIIAIIVSRITNSRQLLFAPSTDGIYGRIVKDFLSFIVGKIPQLNAFKNC